MKIETVGSIKYGNLRFIFKITESIKNYLEKNKIEFSSLLPKTQSFYQGVLIKLGINHNENKELITTFNVIKSEDTEAKDEIQTDQEKFMAFPFEIKGKNYFADFTIQINEKQN